MKKFENDDLNDEQRNFNRRILQTRQIVERSIGVLKMRWRCILGERKLRYSPTKIGHIIISCATLHNYLIANRFDVLHGIDHQVLNNLMNHQINVNVVPPQDPIREVAQNKRNQLAAFLMRFER